MKKYVVLIAILVAFSAAGLSAEGVQERDYLAEADTSDTCISCHINLDPGIIRSYQESNHSSNGVDCAKCHTAHGDDPSGFDHYGTTVTAVPSPAYCAGCHAGEVAQNARSKHAWAAFFGQYKPYYQKAKEMGLDPLAQETARRLDPDKMAKTVVSPLVPDSSVLKLIGLLDNPDYTHSNVNLGCAQCHGTFVIAEEGGKLTGWPNTGVGRVNPDGSLGSCSSCHTRHKFSVEEARKPDTCGQCHLGPDHPQREIYEESKHGNIFASNGETWNWTAPSGEWGPDDIEAPTCAACHISGFGGVVQTTHDVGERLYWELQPKVSVPQWKNADQVDDLVLQRVSDPKQAAAGREQMKLVCGQCHSSSWTDGYFDEFDNVVNDYNMLWAYVDNLLKEAYDKGLISKDLPLDETPEVFHYLIWHHSGRRWRMGAAMMGPDWTHWNGAVDTIMSSTGGMIEDLKLREKIQELEQK